MKKTILLTGASGFLGGNFCHFYRDKYNIIAVYNQNPVEFEGVKSIQLDLNYSNEIEEILKEQKFDFVLHLAASSDPNFCELNSEVSYKNNVKATENLSHICAARKIPLLFASTDLVFDGRNPPYKEEDLPKPVNLYGRQKAEAEEIILNANPEQNIVARLPLMYGNSYASGKNFIQPILQKLKNNEPAFLFSDEYRTVASARSVCEAFVILMNEKANGIYHLGGDES
ncbi:MAG: NAD-dependent epimerase/dehydratase family protein, partial [Sphingobacteriales bacterium]